MVEFSPPIVPTRYERAREDSVGSIEIIEYGDWQLDLDKASDVDRMLKLDDDVCYTITSMGEVYLTEDTAHVDRTMYDTVRMVVIREMIYRELIKLDVDGCVDGLEPTDRRMVTGITGTKADDNG